MSKSLGNSPNPVELIDSYGADALRVGLLIIAPQGLDILFSEDKIEQGRNFMNKLWNSARFILMNIADNNIESFDTLEYNDLDITDKWILSSLNRTILKVNKAYDDYKMNDAVKDVYDFVYNDFCDWYLEFSKSRLYGKDDVDCKKNLIVVIHVLKTILKLLHPYTPFITEEIRSHFSNKTFLINSRWPTMNEKLVNQKIEEELKLIMSLITSIRNVKASFGISPKKEIILVCKVSNEKSKIISNCSLWNWEIN